MTMLKQKLFLFTATLGLLAGCSLFESEDKTPLPGQRFTVLEMQKTMEEQDNAKAAAFVAPDEQANAAWPQAGGMPDHNMQHLALNREALKKIWTADIGEGNQDDLPLIAQPVVSGDRVYTMDTESHVSCFDLETGKELWNRTVKPKGEGEDSITGGLAYSGDLLFVTNGYGELLVLNPADGKIVWKKRLSSPSRAAPTVYGDRVYVVTLDNKISAYSTSRGDNLWDYQALSEVAGIVGAASPAVSDDMVVAAFSSGEIIALRSGNGSVLWQDDLSPVTRVGGLTALPDIQGQPVIDRDMVFAISFGGKFVALDTTTGQRVWQKEISGTETPWAAGNMLFLLTANSELIAVGRDGGAIAWVRSLREYVDKDFAGQGLLWNGPVFAGGRLIVTGPEGNLLEINPENGNVIRRLKLGATVALPPVVAKNTLLLLSDKGKLMAYR